jgi:hypothetical protein
MALPAARPLPMWAGLPLPVRMAGYTNRPCALRVWTKPKEGAVKVTNSRGWRATPLGTPLPPRRPAARSWKLSAW